MGVVVIVDMVYKWLDSYNVLIVGISFVGNFLIVMLIFLLFVIFIMGIGRKILMKLLMSFCLLFINVLGMFFLIIGGGGVFK